jgi:hypothetical protein
LKVIWPLCGAMSSTGPVTEVRGGRMPRGEVLPVVLALEADADRPGGQERLRGEFPIPVAFPVAVRAVVVAE